MADDARAVMRQLLSTYGFNSSQIANILASYSEYVQKSDISPTSYINAILPQTQAYQQRFAGNSLREKAGLSALSPADYLQQEDSYKSILKSYGLPKGFYDTNDDLAGFIGNNISTSELQSRVQAAAEIQGNTDKNLQKTLSRVYGLSRGDFLAYIIDPTKATQKVLQQARTIELATSAATQGLQISRSLGEQLAGATDSTALLSPQQADSVFSQAALTKQSTDLLGSIEGQNKLGADSVINAALNRDAAAQQKIKDLQNREQARFNGTTSNSGAAIAKNTGGSF